TSSSSSPSSSLIGIMLFFDVLEEVRLVVVEDSSSSSSSLIATTALFFGALEDLRLAAAIEAFAGGASGSIVSSIMSCIVDRPRLLVVALCIGAVDVREFSFEEVTERGFVPVGGLEDPEKNAHELSRF